MALVHKYNIQLFVVQLLNCRGAYEGNRRRRRSRRRRTRRSNAPERDDDAPVLGEHPPQARRLRAQRRADLAEQRARRAERRAARGGQRLGHRERDVEQRGQRDDAGRALRELCGWSVARATAATRRRSFRKAFSPPRATHHHHRYVRRLFRDAIPSTARDIPPSLRPSFVPAR